MSEHQNIIISSEESLSIQKAVSRLKKAVDLFDYQSALSDGLERNLLVTFSQPVEPLEMSGWLAVRRYIQNSSG